MIIIWLILTVLFLIFAVLFAIAGEWIIYAFPTVRRLRELRVAWGKLGVNTNGNCSVDQLGEKRFEEISVSTNPAGEVSPILNRRFAKIVAVVSHKDRELRRLAKEMRMYSGLFLTLLLVGLSINWHDIEGKKFSEAAESIFSYHTIPVLELLMIIFSAIRLIVEIQSISLLLEGEE